MGEVTQTFIPGPRLIDGSDLNRLVSQINALLGTSGVTYYVNGTIGNDAGTSATSIGSNNGLNPAAPLATLDAALALEKFALASEGLSSVGRNSIVAFWGTQHRTATLNWNLPGTHLVGLSNSIRRGKRARISPATTLAGTAGFNQLVKVTGAGCQFTNFQTFYGFSNTAAALVNWEDDAGHNCYDNCEFLGFGDGTASTGTANLTGARAFKFNSATGESSWYNCVFGVDTEGRGATNYTLELAGHAPRLHFERCVFEANIVSGGTAGSHVLIGAGGIDRYAKFQQCDFLNAVDSGASAMAQGFNINAAPGGTIFLDQCTTNGLTAIMTTPITAIVMNMVLSTTGGGKAHEVF